MPINPKTLFYSPEQPLVWGMGASGRPLPEPSGAAGISSGHGHV